MILNNVRTFSHGYGAKWTHEGPDVPTPSAFDGIVGSDEYLKHPKIQWACTSCGEKYSTREEREAHHKHCTGRYEADCTTVESEDEASSKLSEFLGPISKLQVCVVPARTHDWLLQLSWLTTFIEDPRIVSIVIYSSMDAAINLEYGISLATKIKLNCGIYLLHMVNDVLNRNVADAVLFTSGIPFEYLSEGYKPQDFLKDALKARHGHLNTFRTDMWYYTQPERGIYPKVGEGLTTYGAVCNEMFQLLGRDWKHPDILGHPAGNIFSLRTADIRLQDSNNALKKLWNLYQTYLGRAEAESASHPTVKEVLALCWGTIFGDPKKYMPETVEPDGKRLAVYGQKCACTISMALFDKCHNMINGKEAIGIEKWQERSPSVGIVIASKLPERRLKISERLSSYPNVSTVTRINFDEAPAVINTEMKARASDGTFLGYLRYIIHNHGNFPDIILFVELNSNIGLDKHSEFCNFIEEIMNLQTHYDKLIIRKDIEICSLEFDNWPEPSEANYAETMYRCISQELSLDPVLPLSIRSPSEATFAVHKDTIMKYPKQTYEKLFDIVLERGVCPSFRSLANRFWAVIFDPERYIVRKSSNSGEKRLCITSSSAASSGMQSVGSLSNNPTADHTRVVYSPFNRQYRYDPAAGPDELTALSLFRDA